MFASRGEMTPPWGTPRVRSLQHQREQVQDLANPDPRATCDTTR